VTRHATQEAIGSKVTTGDSFRILIVDDSRGDRRLVEEYLAAAGPGIYSCASAETLAGALSQVAAGGIDLVLLDLGLPDSWGLDTLNEVRKSAPHLPIVVFTGTNDEEQALRAIQAGAQDYLVKGPLTKMAILRTVRYTIERYRLENALRESAEKLRTVADFTLDWEYWIEPDGKIHYMSPSCLGITGYSAQEFLDDAGLMERIVHPSDKTAYCTHKYEALENWQGMPHGELEFRIVRRDGTVRWIGHVCRPIISSDGVYRGRRGSNRDVTERYDTMRKLARARDFYLTLLEDFPSLIWRCAPDGRYNWFNRRWLEFTGRSLAQEVSLGIVDRVHPHDIDAYLRTFREALATFTPFHAEYRLRAADGTWHWVLDDGNPIRDLERQFAGYIGSCIDISARKAAENQTAQHLLRLASVLEISHYRSSDTEDLLDFSLQQAIDLTESSVGCLYIKDEARGELTLMSRNSGVREKLEFAGEQARLILTEGGPWGDAVREGRSLIVNDPTTSSPFSHGIAAGNFPVQRWMSVPVSHEGRIVAVLVLANKADVFDEADVLQVALLMEGVWRVKSEREAVDEVRSLNAELEQRVGSRTAELASAIRELESFSYSVSHDLRAPLRSLDGFSQALLEEYGTLLDQNGKDYLERIRGASLRMATLIDDLLQLSRVARHALVRERVDLSALAAEVIAERSRETPDRDVAIAIEPGLTVQGDAHLLRIALDNLLTNSWKFTSRTAGARIAFGARTAGGRQEYFVRDNGAGFDPAYAEKLFVAFQRLHSTAEFPGTGVGLTIVQRIIRRHGGEVRGRGSPGGGAEFSFTLAEAP
jgi:PAS domain S-box-containing protein